MLEHQRLLVADPGARHHFRLENRIQSTKTAFLAWVQNSRAVRRQLSKRNGTLTLAGPNQGVPSDFRVGGSAFTRGFDMTCGLLNRELLSVRAENGRYFGSIQIVGGVPHSFRDDFALSWHSPVGGID